MAPSTTLLGRQPARRIMIGTLLLIGMASWAMFFWHANKRPLSEIFITSKVESDICASLSFCKSLEVRQAFSEELKRWTPVIAIRVSNYPSPSSEDISLLHHAIEEKGFFVRALLRDSAIEWLKAPMPIKKSRHKPKKLPSSPQQQKTASNDKEIATLSTPSKEPEQVPQELQGQLY